jgi:hypothetical protein
MFQNKRVYASVAYLVSVAVALYSGLAVCLRSRSIIRFLRFSRLRWFFQLQSYVLSLIATVFQMGACAWYIASYIPLAQPLLRACATRCLPC